METFVLDLAYKALSITVIVGGGGLALYRLGRMIEGFTGALKVQTMELKELKEETKELKEETRQISGVITRMDYWEKRIQLLEERYEELRHGEGFALPGLRPKG